MTVIIGQSRTPTFRCIEILQRTFHWVTKNETAALRTRQKDRKFGSAQSR